MEMDFSSYAAADTIFRRNLEKYRRQSRGFNNSHRKKKSILNILKHHIVNVGVHIRYWCIFIRAFAHISFNLC